MEKTKPQQKNKKESTISTKDAISILYYMNMAIKISKIYQSNNINFVRQSKLLFQSIQNALYTEKEATFMLRQNTLFFNGRKLKFGFSNYFLFKFTCEEFEKRDMGLLSFKPGLTQQEITHTILLLSQKPSSENPLQSFLNQANQKGISHVLAEKLPPYEKLENKKEGAKKVFFLGLTHLKEMFEKHNQEEKLPLITTKRLMQAIFNHLSQNESFLYGLTTLKNFDEYTLNHSVNVCILSISLGKRLGLDRNELVDLGISAFFHDLGKLDIPKEILLKPGKLNPQEREEIEKHPYLGAEKLLLREEFSFLPLRAINVAMEHHTRQDHQGYPKYWKKKKVNLYSKIVKITDFFDAITTNRPYRKKNFTREEALGLMMEKSGTEFDPVILKAFTLMMGNYPVGTLVLLDTGEIGIVYETPEDPVLMLRPKVKLITDKKGHKIDGGIIDLKEKKPQSSGYKRSIVKTLDPNKYNVPIQDYFLAEVS
ncbi:HD domain-containing protein [bacterium]|nr:HD domain-containing protein [bacterium]